MKKRIVQGKRGKNRVHRRATPVIVNGEKTYPSLKKLHKKNRAKAAQRKADHAARKAGEKLNYDKRNSKARREHSRYAARVVAKAIYMSLYEAPRPVEEALQEAA